MVYQRQSIDVSEITPHNTNYYHHMSCDSRLLALRRLLIASSLFLGLSESIEQSSNYYCSALVDWLSPMAGNDMY